MNATTRTRNRPPTRCMVLGDVATGDGRTLRVAVLHEADGTDTLILAAGVGEGLAWTEDPAEGLVVPAGVVPALLEALQRVRREAG